jgi:hypothetical protein
MIAFQERNQTIRLKNSGYNFGILMRNSINMKEMKTYFKSNTEAENTKTFYNRSYIVNLVAMKKGNLYYSFKVQKYSAEC